MNKKNLEKIILNSMKLVANEFDTNELAYLALTSKIELPIRDKWAYILHKKLYSQDFIVSREWKRTDFAIVYKNNPRVLIELKAMYTFDAVEDPKNIKGYPEAMLSDRRKASRLANDNTTIYTVLLVTHPLNKVHPTLKEIIKYAGGINRAFNKLGSSEKIVREAKRIINKKFQDRNVVAEGTLLGGEALGIDANVMYWIIRE